MSLLTTLYTTAVFAAGVCVGVWLRENNYVEVKDIKKIMPKTKATSSPTTGEASVANIQPK